MKKLLKLAQLSVLSFLLSPIPLVAADQPSASLSLSSGSYSFGDTFQTVVEVDSGTANTNVVDAELTYNPTELQLIDVDASTSAYANAVPSKISTAGKVSIARFNITKVSGKAVVAIVNFKHLAGGNSVVNIAGNSSVLSGPKNIWDGVDNAGNFTFSIPAAAPVAPTSTPAKTQSSPQPKPAASTPAAQPTATLADLKQLPPKPTPTPVNTLPLLPYSNMLEVSTSAGALVYLGIIGWLLRSSHPAAVKVRSVKLRRRRQIDNQTI